MPTSREERLTTLLTAAGRGDESSASALFPLVYEELRALARRRMARLPPGQTIQPTALVNEAFVKLCRRDDPGYQGRAHFFRAAARAMRDIIAERARARTSRKRGGGLVGGRGVNLDEASLTVDAPWQEVLALDEATRRLEAEDPRAAEIVTLRFFAGLSNEVAAEALGVSSRTVERHWRFARAWLHRELAGADAKA